ncbi:hypothetical protein MASR2M8_09180 [Opitutaceae bacterium]
MLGLPATGFAATELLPFTITTQLGSFDGPDITGPVRLGAVLYLEATVPHPDGELPVTTYLYWQLHAETGEPVEGRGARETVVLAGGGTHVRRFALPVAGLAEGRYHLALTHQLASDPAVSRQAITTFELRAPHYSLKDLSRTHAVEGVVAKERTVWRRSRCAT